MTACPARNLPDAGCLRAEPMPLVDVALRVNALHGEIMGSLRMSLTAAIEIGGLLAQAKDGMDHGAFGKWLAENVKFSDRSARRYMTVYDHRDRLLKTDSVSDLTGAYRLLAAHGEPDEVGFDMTVGQRVCDELVGMEARVTERLREIGGELESADSVPALASLMHECERLASEMSAATLRLERELGRLLLRMDVIREVRP